MHEEERRRREREGGRVGEERGTRAGEADDRSADGRADESLAERPHELVERVRLQEQVARNDVANDAR